MKLSFIISQIVKIVLFSYLLGFLFVSSLELSVLKAVPPYDNNNDTNGDCYNPRSPSYSSVECAKVRLGLNEIRSESLFVPRNPNDVITIVFMGLLSIVFMFTVFRVIKIGMELAAAGDSGEKRQKAIQNLVWALVALAVSFSSLGIAMFIVVNILGGKVDNTVLDCDKLPPNASQELKDKCELYINN